MTLKNGDADLHASKKDSKNRIFSGTSRDISSKKKKERKMARGPEKIDIVNFPKGHG